MQNCKEYTALKNLIQYLTDANQIQYYDVIQIPAAQIQERGRLNIITPGANYITPSASVIWRKGYGYSRISGTQYFNTGFNPSTAGVKLQKNDCHIAVYLRKNKKEAGVSIGVYNGVNDGIWVGPNWSNGNSYSRLNAGASANHGAVISDSRGLTLGIRNNATQEKLYYDGILKSTITNNSTNIPNGEIWGLCIHDYVGGAPDYLPCTNEIAILSIGTGSVDPLIQKVAFDRVLSELGYAVCSDEWFGDSIIMGYGVTAGKDFVTLIGEARRRDFVNYGTGGQTIVQAADDGSSFNKATIPTYNSKYSGIYVGGWLRNFWKLYGGGQSATTAKFTGDLKANFTDECLAKGVPKEKIWLECGTYVEDNSNFTQANYNTFRTALIDFAKQNGFNWFDSYDYMKDRGSLATGSCPVIDPTDKVHITTYGASLVFENFMSKL